MFKSIIVLFALVATISMAAPAPEPKPHYLASSSPLVHVGVPAATSYSNSYKVDSAAQLVHVAPSVAVPVATSYSNSYKVDSSAQTVAVAAPSVVAAVPVATSYSNSYKVDSEPTVAVHAVHATVPVATSYSNSYKVDSTPAHHVVAYSTAPIVQAAAPVALASPSIHITAPIW